MATQANAINGLGSRARRFATIIQLLYARQQLSGHLRMVARGARHLSYGVRLSDPMKLDDALKLAEPMALSCGVQAVLAQRSDGLVSYQVELPPAFWEYYTRADLPIPQAIGLAEQRRPVEFELDPPHILVAGSTGAGKSETVKTILTALMLTRRPEELGVLIADPERDYEDFQNEAHLLLPIATEPADIANVLRYANEELRKRRDGNIRDGRIDKAILLVIDEAETVLADPASLAIARVISKQARKRGIHLLLSTQKPLHGNLPGILDNLLNRYVGQLADANTSARVTGHAGLMAHKLTPKGDFLHITGPDVNRFQVAQATLADIGRLERREVRPVPIPAGEVIELPAELPERGPGRPQLQVNMEYLAWYFYHNPDKVSRAMARELLGLSRDNHELHQAKCREFVAAYLKLSREGRLLA